VAYRLLDGGEDLTALPESHLGFGGVDVYVYLLGGKVHPYHGHGVTSFRQKGVIGLIDGVAQELISHPAAVDEDGQVSPAGSMEARSPHISADPEPFGFFPQGLL
jgi:hypothetical protein